MVQRAGVEVLWIDAGRVIAHHAVGAAAGDLVGAPVGAVVAGDHRAAFERSVAAAAAGVAGWLDVITADGRAVRARVRPRAAGGAVVVLVPDARPAAGRRAAALLPLIERASVGVGVIDDTGRVTRATRRFAALIGRDPCVGCDLDELAPLRRQLPGPGPDPLELRGSTRSLWMIRRSLGRFRTGGPGLALIATSPSALTGVTGGEQACYAGDQDRCAGCPGVDVAAARHAVWPAEGSFLLVTTRVDPRQQVWCRRDRLADPLLPLVRDAVADRLAARVGLTGREADLLRAIVRGADDHGIARELRRSIRTVRFHVRNILDKTGATSRHDLLSRLVGAS